MNVGYGLILCIGKPPLDVTMAPKDQPTSKSASTWTWFPSWQELTTHYFKEVGFLACLAQMIGATIFVSGDSFTRVFFFSFLDTPPSSRAIPVVS
jgi:hypothetical protein